MLAQAKTDIGKVRETNEDSFICNQPLFVVADGMGGHVAGEIASRMAIETITDFMSANTGTALPNTLLDKAINEASMLIAKQAQENEDYADMGTTVTAVYVEVDKIYWGHVGDSRLYLLRDNKLIQITQDHSLVNELVRSGSITKEEAYTHPQRNILTRAVGVDEWTEVDTGVFDWKSGDMLLLCTDGLTNLVSDEEIIQTVTACESHVNNSVDELLAKANKAGGFDNITVILVKNGDS